MVVYQHDTTVTFTPFRKQSTHLKANFNFDHNQLISVSIKIPDTCRSGRQPTSLR